VQDRWFRNTIGNVGAAQYTTRLMSRNTRTSLDNSDDKRRSTKRKAVMCRSWSGPGNCYSFQGQQGSVENHENHVRLIVKHLEEC
jgi:hypothetical protein